MDLLRLLHRTLLDSRPREPVMFYLTEVELDDAFEAIKHHGYNIFAPTPPEWQVLADSWQEFREFLAKQDLDQYQPRPTMRLYAPKSRINIRVVTLLHPYDVLIYTALTLIVRDDIEAARIPVSENRLFSNRVGAPERGRLFEPSGQAYRLYRESSSQKAIQKSTKVVAVTDVADFFPRIYQHRLENVVRAIARDQRVEEVARVLVKKFVNFLERGNSYGLPVGPHASSVLAEAVLIDVDSALVSENFDFVRWFDDYVFFCEDESHAQRALFFLAEWLHTHHGLTLQPAKTSILSRDSFLKGLSRNYEERLKRRAEKLYRLLRIVQTAYGEVTVPLGPAELVEIEAVNLKEALLEAMNSRNKTDYELAQFILGRIATSGSVPLEKKLEVVDAVLENLAEFYPIAGTLARFLGSLDPGLPSVKKKQIANAVLRPLLDERNPPPPYYGMWILNMIAEHSDWDGAELIRAVYSKTRSDVVQRYAALALAKIGNRSDVLQTTTDIDKSTALLRTAILLAWHKLGSDERSHWKRASVLTDLLEKKL